MENAQFTKNEQLQIALIQPDQNPGHETQILVTLRFSHPVTNISEIRKNVLNALVNWAEDGPGFTSENKDAFTKHIAVDELPEKPDVLATIEWAKEDLMGVFRENRVEETPENIERFIQSRAFRTLEEVLVTQGWDVLDDLVCNLVAEGVLETTGKAGRHIL